MELEGGRVFLRREAVEPEVLACGAGTAVMVTRPAPHRTSPDLNQDGALLLPLDGTRGVLAVADGVGGGPSGADAAGAALETLARTITAAVRRGDALRGAILDGIERAQTAVRAVGGGAATTLAVVAIDGERLRPFHVGDSEILLTGQRGRVKHVTIAHAPVAYAVESGMLGEEAAMRHDERHLVDNALGLPEFRIEIGPDLRIAPRDTLVLATDGLTDNLYRDEIVDGARVGALADGVLALARAARRRMEGADGEADPGERDAAAPSEPGKPDDVTIILWRPSA